ncbi:hypothetical protein [Thiothrix fructosivorans]|uniref:Transglycosylase SLT domain-containing protein n=1 Tax=Thiothrix fructosivorans TaxID=111770 RepID=A0A8B0SIL6_9GAMM|nr:hypothetical protein [Thiothrix fructosivorans]MBO0611701.1 hypothetical protein [Thiothrix fructosivorans]QTX10639.1 hypothetical protein J1836_019075 [Thiothrix fructosivorans]
MNNGIARGIVDTAQSLGMRPLDLATIVSYETAGTFDPRKKGPTTQWGQHEGLIQFGKPQAKQFGVNWNDPVNSQLGANGAVAKYFRASGWKPGMDLLNAYSIVNAGAPGKFNASDAGNGGAPGTVRDKVQNQMGDHMRKASKLLSAAFPSSGVQYASNQYAGTQADIPPQDTPPSLAEFAAKRRQPANTSQTPSMADFAASRKQPGTQEGDAPPSLAEFAAQRRNPSTTQSESVGYNMNPTTKRPTLTPADAPKVDAATALGAGVVRGLKDLPGGLAEIAGKVHESGGIRGMFDFIPTPDFVKDIKDRNRQWEGEIIQSVKDWNAADEADYQAKFGDSGTAQLGRVGGNVATAFIPGTGQVKAMQGIGNMVKAGKTAQAMGAGAGLGMAQSAALSGGEPADMVLGATLGGLLPGIARMSPMMPDAQAGRYISQGVTKVPNGL